MKYDKIEHLLETDECGCCHEVIKAGDTAWLSEDRRSLMCTKCIFDLNAAIQIEYVAELRKRDELIKKGKVCSVCGREGASAGEGRIIDGSWANDENVKSEFKNKWVCCYKCYHKTLTPKGLRGITQVKKVAKLNDTVDNSGEHQKMLYHEDFYVKSGSGEEYYPDR